VTKLDRLARSLRDAKDIVEELTRREVKLSIGGSVHDPTDPVGRLLFNVLAMVAEFEADLIRARTREGMAVAKAKGRLRGKQPKLSKTQEAHLVSVHLAGTHTTVELAELFGVAPTLRSRLAPQRTSYPPVFSRVLRRPRSMGSPAGEERLQRFFGKLTHTVHDWAVGPPPRSEMLWCRLRGSRSSWDVGGPWTRTRNCRRQGSLSEPLKTADALYSAPRD